MFLHLGGDILLNQKKIVAILDLETSTKGTTTGKFITKIKNTKQINYVSEKGKEKSFIITTDGYYFSPISSTTLLKRSISFT
ncbi:MAG: extracellular matrix/biofilm biosynthesis regulator RemA family protein [Desulfitobacteriaceae bacterium]